VSTSPFVVALALTTTALGTLLPILRDNQMLGGVMGRYTLAAGAVGELAPIVAMAVFLGSAGSAVEVVALVLFLGLAVTVARFPSLLGHGRLARIIIDREHETAQSTLRLAIALLFVLLWLADDFGFDSVLGAFVAGMVLRAWAPGDVDSLERKLDAVGYGFFIPVFFVQSGMTLDVDSIVDHPLALLVFVALMLVMRGLPALFWYRRDLPLVQRWELALITATALPLLIALTEVGVRNGHMLPSAQATIVGAGVVSVLVFPIIAIELRRRVASRDPRPSAVG
jgi:Kef-type K+ transport system membrane component KefB